MLQAYYAALKPERTYANVMTTLASFLFACAWHIDWALFVATIVGTSLVVMSACGVNNVTDAKLDADMPRTKKRATVTGEVRLRNLVILSIILGAVGFATLALWVGWLVVLLGAIGYVDYVLLYAWTKRATPWSTLVGTISGAVPLVAGYVAVTQRFDGTALLLGLTMLCWQMAHFYAIGVYRLKDYKAGHLPIWPVRYGARNTQWWILVWVTLYLVAIDWLTGFGNMGALFFWSNMGLGLYWLARGVRGFYAQKPEPWARGMFGLSLVVLLWFSATTALSPLLF